MTLLFGFFFFSDLNKYVLCGTFPLPWLTEMEAFCWVYCSTFELSAQIRLVQQVTSHVTNTDSDPVVCLYFSSKAHYSNGAYFICFVNIL